MKMQRFSGHMAMVLLGFLILPLFVVQHQLRKQIRSIKQEVQLSILKGLPKEELRTFHFNTEQQKQIRWEHEHEFEWKGQMYDVISVHQEGNDLVIECWPDQKESKLKQHMRTMWAKAMGSDPTHQGEKDKLYQFLSHLYFEQATSAPAPLLGEKHLGCSITHSETHRGFPFIPETPPRYS